jgi:imidazolonepropionase-like amidohydrolase
MRLIRSLPRCALAALLLAVDTNAAASQVPLRAGDVVLRGGWLFDAVADEAVRNTGIVVRNGVLLEVGATLSGRDLSPARVIDLAADEYILPGLFDLHAHYAVDLFGEGRVDEHTVNPLLFLANGVTSTFPAGEMDPEAMRAARERIDAGTQIGPRIYNSGPYFGTARPGWRADAMTPDSIRREVDYWAARGARAFKAKGIRPEQLDALIGQAHLHGLTVTGHLESGFRNSVNPRDAILMGIDRIEHFIGGDAIAGDKPAYSSLESLDVARPEVGAAIRAFIDHGVYFDATLTAYGYYGAREPVVFDYWIPEMDFLTPYARNAVHAAPPRRVNDQFERIYNIKRKTVRAFHDAGGARWITLGTDHPSWGEFFSGFGSHRELHAFVLAGIPPATALKIGTINGARALNVDSKLGTIEAGKYADLFIVKGNPLADIRNTHNVRIVMKAGLVYDAAELLAAAKGKLGPAGPADAAKWKGSTAPRL